MSVSNLATILIRAIEARETSDSAARIGVYELSRRTVERFLTESGDLSDAERARQRHELDRVIEAIEKHYGAGRTTAPDPTEIMRRTLRTPTPTGSVPPPVRPAGAVPPEAPRAPLTAPGTQVEPPSSLPPAAPPSLPKPASCPIAPPAVGREAPRAESPFAVVPPAPVNRTDAPCCEPAQECPSGKPLPVPAANAANEVADLFAEGVENEQPEKLGATGGVTVSSQRNLARAFLLIAALAVLAFLRLTDLGADLRRILSGEKSASEATLKSLDSTESGVPEGWSRIAAHLTAPTEAGVSGAFLWNEAKGSIEKGTAGRVAWTPQSRSGTISWIGRLKLTDEPLEAEIIVEPDEEKGTSETPPLMMMMLRFTGLPEKVAGTPNFYRVDPRTGRHGLEDGSVVRIGIDGFLVGYRPQPSDSVTDPAQRSMFLIDFALDDDKHLRLFLSPPATAKPTAP